MPWALLSSSCCTSSARPVGPVGQRNGENVATAWRAGARFQLVLPRLHIDLVIMQGMQGGGGGRGHPGAVGARLRDGRSWPSACRPCGRASPTCPCRSAPCPGSRRPDRYRHSGLHRPSARCEVFISPLRIIGAGLHRGVHLVAGAVQKAGIDEDDAVLGGADDIPSG